MELSAINYYLHLRRSKKSEIKLILDEIEAIDKILSTHTHPIKYYSHDFIQIICKILNSTKNYMHISEIKREIILCTDNIITPKQLSMALNKAKKLNLIENFKKGNSNKKTYWRIKITNK